MMPRNIKLFWSFGAMLTVLALVLAAAVMWPRVEVGELYRRYEANPHLAITFLKNFAVGDTLAVDVTTLQALDDEGWDTLMCDFGIQPMTPAIRAMIAAGEDIVTVRLSPRNDPKQTMDTTDRLRNDVVAISRLKHTICVFHTVTASQQDAIVLYNLRKNYIEN